MRNSRFKLKELKSGYDIPIGAVGRSEVRLLGRLIGIQFANGSSPLRCFFDGALRRW